MSNRLYQVKYLLAEGSEPIVKKGFRSKWFALRFAKEIESKPYKWIEITSYYE